MSWRLFYVIFICVLLLVNEFSVPLCLDWLVLGQFFANLCQFLPTKQNIKPQLKKSKLFCKIKILKPLYKKNHKSQEKYYNSKDIYC